MGRKKKYDRDTLVEKAMELFRDHGYASTSTQMLVEQLGVNRFSLSAEFGSKQGLFDAALECYDKQVVERNFGPLEAPTAGVEEIRALLEFYASAGNGSATGRGCLLCNTAIEFGREDPSGAEYIQRYFKRLSNAFYKALNNAHSKGVLRNVVALKEEADFFTASTLGLFVLMRANAPLATIENASKMAIEHLEGLCI
jgi:TetR/AcrR family transcriptional repressor of nem operon